MSERTPSPRAMPSGQEVLLLPRHWAWLSAQPRSASATLRSLVECGLRDVDGQQRRRAAKDACYRYLRGEAGDRPDFEAACRALYAGEPVAFEHASDTWPEPVRSEARRLAAVVTSP